MELIILLLILLIISLWKWWSYKCLSIGLMYFASKEHGWVISDMDMKKILEYSMKRNIKDLLKR